METVCLVRRGIPVELRAAGPVRRVGDGRGSRRSVARGRPGSAGQLKKTCASSTLPRHHSARTAYSAHELGAPAGRTRVIYGRADPLRYAPDANQARRGVLFVGRLTPHKGVDRLLQALPAGVLLRVVGSTGHDRRLPERDYLRL